MCEARETAIAATFSAPSSSSYTRLFPLVVKTGEIYKYNKMLKTNSRACKANAQRAQFFN
jgi:hypothetical protein